MKNKVFGRLTVIKLSDVKKNNAFLWECLCICGNLVYAGTQNLLTGHKKSCGCIKVDLVGLIFGELTVLSEFGIKKYDKTHSERRWLCKCSCGGHTNLSTAVLTKNKVKTCGCSANFSGNINPNWKGYGEISASMWGRIKSGAKSRKLDFDIDIKQAWDLFLKQNKKCALSGMPINFGKTRLGESATTASLDRINSKEGYIIDNIQWLHKDVNLMKWNLDQDYFLLMCEKINTYEG